jgi:transcriptional regulator with GAF, ATPase, and Fis domain
LILKVLEQNDFNTMRTADHLKITRHSLRYRMQRLSISVADSAESEATVADEREIIKT